MSVQPGADGAPARADVAGWVSEHGWVRIAYDTATWIPCPPGFPAGHDLGSWAAGYAKVWWDAAGIPHTERDVAGLAQSLASVHQGIYGQVACHLAFIHLPPNPRLGPLPLCLGVWPMYGEREAQLRLLTHADDPKATKPPVVEPVCTQQLGQGLRVLRYLRQDSGPEVIGCLEYAWRSEEHQTDLRVFAAAGDLGRLQMAAPDIDEFTRGITVVPRG
jgi:hypothetical protein